MRQAGLMAAAGLYALENNVARLADDHANARLLAERLAAIDGVTTDPAQVQTNMVFIQLPADAAVPLREFLAQRGMMISGGTNVRLVTHLDVGRDHVVVFSDAVREFFRDVRKPTAQASAIA